MPAAGASSSIFLLICSLRSCCWRVVLLEGPGARTYLPSSLPRPVVRPRVASAVASSFVGAPEAGETLNSLYVGQHVAVKFHTGRGTPAIRPLDPAQLRLQMSVHRSTVEPIPPAHHNAKSYCTRLHPSCPPHHRRGRSHHAPLCALCAAKKSRAAQALRLPLQECC